MSAVAGPVPGEAAVLERSGTENFSVASLVLGRATRDHLLAVYGFVLHIFGAATPSRIAQSDAVCTALQLLEHWQDVHEDYANGRIYLPAEDLERFEVAPGDFEGDAYARLMSFEIARARKLLDEGAPL